MHDMVTCKATIQVMLVAPPIPGCVWVRVEDIPPPTVTAKCVNEHYEQCFETDIRVSNWHVVYTGLVSYHHELANTNYNLCCRVNTAVIEQSPRTYSEVILLLGHVLDL